MISLRPSKSWCEGQVAVVLEGSVSIRDLESQYQLSLPRDAGFETLAGFVLARLQRIPRQGDTFEYEGHRYTVLEMEGSPHRQSENRKTGGEARHPSRRLRTEN